MITVRILKDSITEDGDRMTTWEWTYHRLFHSEVMTHRALSKNAASSRAIPASKLRQRVIDTPAIPVHWGANQAGMQASEEILDAERAHLWWMEGRDLMVSHHKKGEALGLHKQVINRVIEPWMMITTIVSGTDWANFFHLRNHPDAEPNFRRLASLAWEEYHNHMPTYVGDGGWHTPLVDENEAIQLSEGDLKKVSTGRCARVSYLTHDGKRDFTKDIELHDKLLGTINSGGPGHLSPFEHVARATPGRHGNLEGWKPYRKFFLNENGPDTSTKCKLCGCWEQRHVKGCGNIPATQGV